MATFYRTVVLYVLLYGSESWVLKSDLMRQLRSFQRRCCQGLTGDFIRQDEEGGWICPKSEEVLKKAGVLDDRGVHSEEAGYNHEIRGDEEYIWEVQKLPKDSYIVATYFGGRLIIIAMTVNPPCNASSIHTRVVSPLDPASRARAICHSQSTGEGLCTDHIVFRR
jgi:hypothetical protein